MLGAGSGLTGGGDGRRPSARARPVLLCELTLLCGAVRRCGALIYWERRGGDGADRGREMGQLLRLFRAFSALTCAGIAVRTGLFK